MWKTTKDFSDALTRIELSTRGINPDTLKVNAPLVHLLENLWFIQVLRQAVDKRHPATPFRVIIPLLKRCLSVRWSIIAETDASYFQDFQLPLNRFIETLVQVIAKQAGGHPLLLLAPTLEATSVIRYVNSNPFEEVESREETWGTERFLRLFVGGIPLSGFFVLPASSDELQVTHEIVSANQEGAGCFLSVLTEYGHRREMDAAQKVHLLTRPHVAPAVHATSAYLQALYQADNALGALKRLIAALRRGKAPSGGEEMLPGMGTEYDAGDPANLGILEFYQFYVQLSEADQETLKAVSYIDYRSGDAEERTLGDFLYLLFAEDIFQKEDNDEENKRNLVGEVRWCVEIIANELEDLVDIHHESLAKIRIIDGEQQADLSELRVQRDVALSDLQSGIQAGYDHIIPTFEDSGYVAICLAMVADQDFCEMIKKGQLELSSALYLNFFHVGLVSDNQPALTRFLNQQLTIEKLKMCCQISVENLQYWPIFIKTFSRKTLQNIFTDNLTEFDALLTLIPVAQQPSFITRISLDWLVDARAKATQNEFRYLTRYRKRQWGLSLLPERLTRKADTPPPAAPAKKNRRTAQPRC